MTDILSCHYAVFSVSFPIPIGSENLAFTYLSCILLTNRLIMFHVHILFTFRLLDKSRKHTNVSMEFYYYSVEDEIYFTLTMSVRCVIDISSKILI